MRALANDGQPRFRFPWAEIFLASCAGPVAAPRLRRQILVLLFGAAVTGCAGPAGGFVQVWFSVTSLPAGDGAGKLPAVPFSKSSVATPPAYVYRPFDSMLAARGGYCGANYPY
jgi:hypothetical protein